MENLKVALPMDDHVSDYYKEFADDSTPSGSFHKVIAVHESPELEWDALLELALDFPRGWFELAHLPSADRIEFVREFWVSQLPYVPHVHEGLVKFFASLEDIGIYITQKAFDDPFFSTLVYSIEDNGGFFHGSAPIEENNVAWLQKTMDDVLSSQNYLLPVDYLAFLRVHDGFCKFTDTGLIPSTQLALTYQQFQPFLAQQEPLVSLLGGEVNPKSLIPFYESFGLHCYQCFWGEWYPDQEMGNVYYSGIEKTLSSATAQETFAENMAFPTFLDWLLFYLEAVE